MELVRRLMSKGTSNKCAVTANADHGKVFKDAVLPSVLERLQIKMKAQLQD
jgi:hypothetical protein